MPVAGIVGVVGSIASAVIGASAAKKAAKLQANAAHEAMMEQRRAGKVATAAVRAAERRSQLAIAAAERRSLAATKAAELKASKSMQPYSATGRSALKTIAGLYGVDGGSKPMAAKALAAFRSAPDFAVSYKAGIDAVNNADAGSRSLLSGAHFKRLAQFSSDHADLNFNNYISRLQAMAGMGQNADSSLANIATHGGDNRVNIVTGAGNNSAQITNNAGTTVANAVTGNASQVGQLGMQGAAAQASGVVGAANAITGGIDSATSSLAYLANRYQPSYNNA